MGTGNALVSARSAEAATEETEGCDRCALTTSRRSQTRVEISREKCGQAGRLVSTGQLNVLPRLHLRPINVVVFHVSQGEPVLELASRLDAFSAYPFRT